MGYLIAVALTPLLGPLLYRALHDEPRAVEAVDNFVYVAVPILVASRVYRPRSLNRPITSRSSSGSQGLRCTQCSRAWR